MSALMRRRLAESLAGAALLLLPLGLVSVHPATAQTRTLVTLADVPVYVPAPYHPHTATASYGSLLYDGSSYYGGVYLAGGAHYWH